MRIDNASGKITGLAAGTASGESARYDESASKADASGGTLLDPMIKGARTPFGDLATLGNGTYTINPSNGHYYKFVAQTSASIALAISWPAGVVSDIELEIVNGGGATITFTPTVNFITGSGATQANPNAALQTSGTDLITLTWNGSTARGKVIR